jgi:predicted ribonuclease YlaK
VAASQRVVVDVANLLGSRADGWWCDRVGATRALLDKIGRLPLQDQQMILVLEGQARASAAEGELGPGLRVVHASRSGDDEIIAIIRASVAEHRNRAITVITADLQLRGRAEAFGAASQSPYALRDRLDQTRTVQRRHPLRRWEVPPHPAP